jgi:5'-phosphate synthase pdxT subunit
VFIRAPGDRTGGRPRVEVLATRIDGDPVLVPTGRVMVASFHPELAGDDRVHELFVG